MATVFDLVSLIAIGWFLFSGIKSGLIESVMKLIGATAAVYLTMNYSMVGLQYLEKVWDVPSKYESIAGFVTVFLVTIYAFQIAASFMRKIVHGLLLGWVDRTGGAVFGLLKAGVLLSSILWILNLLPADISQGWQKDAKILPVVLSVQNVLVSTFNLEDELDLIHDTGNKLFERTKNSVIEDAMNKVEEELKKK
jgi:uncharacterized membrane protein required for colicin V production